MREAKKLAQARGRGQTDQLGNGTIQAIRKENEKKMNERVSNMNREQIQAAIERWKTVLENAVFDGERMIANRMIDRYSQAMKEAEKREAGR